MPGPANSTAWSCTVHAQRHYVKMTSVVAVQMLTAAEHDSAEPQAADDALDAHWARADDVQAVECEEGSAAVLQLALRSVRGG